MTIINKTFGVDVDGRQTVNSSKRGTGFAVEKVQRKDLNQLLSELSAQWIIGSQAQVTALEANTYYDSGTTSFKDKNGATVVFSDGDHIAWRGLDAITANIDVSTIDDLEHIMFQGVTIDLLTFDLDLGENQRGELDLTGTGGTLTVLSSDGLRVKTGGSLSVVNNAGDVIINNSTLSKDVGYDGKNTEVSVVSNTEAVFSADNIRLPNGTENVIVINGISETFDVTTDLNAGTEKTTSWYQGWLASDQGKSIERKVSPEIFSIADGTASFKLIDSTASFQTDLVKVGDEVINETDLSRTTVGAIDSETQLTLNDDIFVSGENYTLKVTPTFSAGKIFQARVCRIFNNTSGNFEYSERAHAGSDPNKITKTRWRTTNGYGSTNTAIQKFTTEEEKSNDVVATVINSSTDGFSITANMKCKVDIFFSKGSNTNTYAGLTKNSSELSTVFTTLTDKSVILAAGGSQTNLRAMTSWSGVLEAGDTVRPHTQAEGEAGSTLNTIGCRAEEIRE